MYDRYLLRHPETRVVIETPQQFFLRVACALSENVLEALELYRLFSSLEYLPSSPTLFNAGTRHEQLSRCFLLDSPADHLESIYRKYTDVALLSKFSGGIGLAYSPRALARLADRSDQRPLERHRAVAEDARRLGGGGESGRQAQGRLRVYLEPWHADIEEFLELRDNTGDEARRTHNLNLAQLGAGSVHAPSRGRRRMVPVRPEARAGLARPLRRGVRASVRSRRERRARTSVG